MPTTNRLFPIDNRRQEIINSLKKGRKNISQLKCVVGIGESQLRIHIKALLDFGCIGREIDTDATWGNPPYIYYYISSCICYDNF